MAARHTVTLLCICATAISVPYLRGFVSSDELSLLQDPEGWEYVKVVTDSGFPTEHPCFDGSPHTDTRTGRYKVDGHELTFFDEYDTQDGPYKLTLDSQGKTLVLELGSERMDLMLEKEYLDRSKAQKKKTEPKQ
jgi:hypothetical protein